MNLTLTQPDDWHLHLRDGVAMADVVGATAAVFGRAVVMPNLSPPVTTTEAAMAYRRRILDALPAASGFTPLMTLYLTDLTPPEEVRRAGEAGIVAFKLYPAGATTNSDAGVTDIDRIAATIEAMAERGMVLSVHGELTDPGVDIFDREKAFIDSVLEPLIRRSPGLKVVFEHVTTKDAVDFVQSSPPRIGATITPQHLLLNRNDLLVGGVKPHHYCLPVLKREIHRRALVGRRDRRRSAFLSRHRQRASRAVDEGESMRLRGLFHGSRRAGSVCRGLRGCRGFGTSGGLCLLPRR